jgi:hypothetical protein
MRGSSTFVVNFSSFLRSSICKYSRQGEEVLNCSSTSVKVVWALLVVCGFLRLGLSFRGSGHFFLSLVAFLLSGL